MWVWPFGGRTSKLAIVSVGKFCKKYTEKSEERQREMRKRRCRIQNRAFIRNKLLNAKSIQKREKVG